MFIEATNMFSQSNTPLLYEVIPVIDALQANFDEIKDDLNIPDVVRHGAARASVVLSKYYSLTDDSEVYRIAMCMSCAWFFDICAHMFQCFILSIRLPIGSRRSGKMSGSLLVFSVVGMCGRSSTRRDARHQCQCQLLR